MEASVPVARVRTLTLVRHGETAENAAGRFLGRGDPPLSAIGESQAQSLAAAFGDLGRRDATVVSSPALRARQTATALAGTQPFTILDALREVDFGTWEGHTREQVAAFDPDGLERFEHGPILGFPRGERIEDVARRALDMVCASPADHLIAISHATTIRVLVAVLLGIPASEYRQHLGRPGNGSWSCVRRHESGWRLVSYGCTPSMSERAS